jgi:hypothetical protein
MEMGFNDVANLKASFMGVIKIDLDVAPGINHNGEARALISHQIAGMGETI